MTPLKFFTQVQSARTYLSPAKSPADFTVALAGLSNCYTHYITTYEEYQEQRYEAGSTLYGPHTLQAYLIQFSYLTKNLLQVGFLCSF